MKFLIKFSTYNYFSDSNWEEDILVCDTQHDAENMVEEFNQKLKHWGLHAEQDNTPESALNRWKDSGKGWNWIPAEFCKEAKLPKLNFDVNQGTYFYCKPVREWFDEPETK